MRLKKVKKSQGFLSGLIGKILIMLHLRTRENETVECSNTENEPVETDIKENKEEDNSSDEEENEE